MSGAKGKGGAAGGDHHVSNFNILMSNCKVTVNSEDTNIGIKHVGIKAEEPKSTKKSKLIAGVYVIREILERHDGPMLFAELELELKQHVKEMGLKSFNEMSGLGLNDFLTLQKNTFDVDKKKGKLHVKIHKKRKKSQSRSETEKDKVENDSVSCNVSNAEPDASKSDRAIDLPRNNNGTKSSVTDLQFKDADWQVVKPKKCSSRKAQQITENEQLDTLSDVRSSLNNQNYCGGIQKTQSIKEFSYESEFGTFDEFQNLICHSNKTLVCLTDLICTYEVDPLRFSLDVVSMWNTPQRISSHIVIGCQSQTEHNGVEKSVDKDFFNNLFQESVFNTKPKFQVYKVLFNNSLFYVIEISSSIGHGHPCFVTKDAESRTVSVRQNQLWTRKSGANCVCEPSEMMYGVIFHWFLGGNKPSHEKSERQIPMKENMCVPNVCDAGTQSPKLEIEEEMKTKNDTLYNRKPNINRHDTIHKKFGPFWDFVKGFKKGHFVLITGDVCCSTRRIDAFGLIPWLSVYDFDIFSHRDGLLNAVQDNLKTRRYLKTFCWNDSAEYLSEEGTRWCFMRGSYTFSSSRTDEKNGEIEDTKRWFKQTRNQIDAYIDQLSNFVQDYTVLTVVVFWPENEKLVPFMTKFLERLNDALPNAANMGLCMNSTETKTETGTSRLETLCDDYKNALSIFQIKFETLAEGIERKIEEPVKGTTRYKLPTKVSPDETMPEVYVTEEEAAWLGEDLFVLYSNCPFSHSVLSPEDVQNEVTQFYKGGTLPWFVWYSNDAENSVIERTIQKELEKKLIKHLTDYKTTIMTLMHAPGSGGTTLAQTILWLLHKSYPCLQLKLRSNSQLDDLDRKTSFLYEKTGLPVLLLVDAEEEPKVRALSKRLRYTVILYVKRYTYKQSTGDNYKVYLSGYVTAKESKELATKLGERCFDDTQKINLLYRLANEVKDGSKHCMYEFGMAVYLHEFKGIVSYVEGYLELKKNSGKELTAWQKCLGFLALVYYYGQVSVPCQFFAALFHKPGNYAMELEDFPAPIEEFIVYDKNEGRRKNIRICHYIIAKEILEQILSRHTSMCSQRTDGLSLSSCRNLSTFCLDFIHYTGSRKNKGQRSSTITLILTKTFIFRDERDMGDNEEQVRKRPVLSKLMIDIPAGKLLFTERLRVLQKLVDTFPEDPHFWAHLGRFYAFCRPDEEHEAEKCFQKAVRLCDEQTQGRTVDNIDDGMKLTMMHIYHMYGIVKQRYIAKYTGRSLKEKVVSFGSMEIFNEQLEDIVSVAEEACEYFARSRDITPENHEKYIYAYTGEIQVRLQICEFVNRHYKTEYHENSIKDFFTSNSSNKSKTFVKNSIFKIENLILECYMEVDLLGKDVESLKKQVIWYNTIFTQQMTTIDDLTEVTDSVTNRRLKIARNKLNCGKSNVLNGIETMEDALKLKEIVSLYEENFSDIQKYGFQDGDGKKDLEREFLDWIFAIRNEQFPESYDLEDVLSKVCFWEEKVGSPISIFYVFVIYSLLGFGCGNTPGKTECMIEALRLRETVYKMNHLVLRSKYPREWLGNSGEGIKLLKCGKRYIGMCIEDRDSSSAYRSDYAVCKGTICRPNTHNVSGMISMDLGVHGPDVKVFFIPKVAKLDGSRFCGNRVEFNLAFTIQHGYEAYNVKLLRRFACSNCSRKLEFTSVETVGHCKCGHEVERDELAEVRE